MTALSDVSTHAMASARWRVSEVAFWILALACAFLFPSRYLIMTDIVRLGLFALSLDNGLVRQLTDLREGPAPDEDDEAEGHKAFLEDQQEELFENIRLKRQREAEAEARVRADAELRAR